jgi:hypothetical protein
MPFDKNLAALSAAELAPAKELPPPPPPQPLPLRDAEASVAAAAARFSVALSLATRIASARSELSLVTARKRLLLSAFHMFVPSLSW